MPSWFLPLNPAPHAQIRLFCFPYAGGGMPVFRTWPQGLPDIEVWAANLPGRGSRFNEEPLTSMAELVRILAHHLPSSDPHESGNRPFAFFGHSMGARIAFELALTLRRAQQTSPVHLFLSACPAPQLPHEHSLHTLPPAEFQAALERRGGIPAAVLAEPELLDLLLPIVRADLMLYETAVYHDEPPLATPITTLDGSEDPIVTPEALSAWSAQTTAAFQQIIFPGDHFYLRTAEAHLFRTIEESNNRYMKVMIELD